MKNIIPLLILMIVFTGCELMPLAPTGEIKVSYKPNPATDPTYLSVDGWTWTVDIEIREENGWSVELDNWGPKNSACVSVFVLDNYQVVDTFFYSKSDINAWFGSTDINAYGSIKSYGAQFSTFNYNQGKYIETYYGVDSDGNYIKCTDTLELVNNKKKGIQ